MRKILVVAVREYNAAVRTKAFLISLILMPLLMGGSALMQLLLKDQDIKDKKLAVIDRTPDARIAGAIKTAMDAYNRSAVNPETGKQVRPRYEIDDAKLTGDTAEALAQARAELESRMRSGDILGFLVVGPDVFQPVTVPTSEQKDLQRQQVVYETNRLTGLEFQTKLDNIINEAVQEVRAKKFGIPNSQRKDLTARVPLVLHAHVTFAVPFVLMILMFLVLMMVANPLMQGVVEEKMQRVAEVLLGSVAPFPLMLGKLLGMTAVSLTIVSVYVVGAVWGAHHFGFGEYIPSAHILVWFFIFQILAALMYGSLFIAIGAACTDMKETQNLLLPVMLICCLPLFMMVQVIREPNSPVVTALSFFPFATPMLMIARQSVPPGVSAWEPVAGVAIVIAATLLCVWAAGRIFRVGLLMQGKGANLAEMVRWVFRG